MVGLPSYQIETRSGPKAPWKVGRFATRYRDAQSAIAFAREMDDHGGCSPIRVVDNERRVVWIPRDDLARIDPRPFIAPV